MINKIKAKLHLATIVLILFLIPTTNVLAQTNAEKAAILMPPVIQSLDIPEVMQAGTAYTLSWSVLGYHNGYKSIIALFDCTGETDCGASIDDASLFENSSKLDPDSSEDGNWNYLGVNSTVFNFSYDFTPQGFDTTTDIVIRFYQINDDDNGNVPTISLTIPGDIAIKYDNSGRRISKIITPDPNPPVAVPKLPDTGQTTSYTSVFGEDADYSINPQSFTDNGDGTVTDNNTTLMWQQDIDNVNRTWDDAVTHCSNLSTGGYSDWRLPDVKELKSIADYDKTFPSIDTTYFPGTIPNWYWSSTIEAQNLSSAWVVGFYFARAYSTAKASVRIVRCVRSDSESTLWAFDFVDNSDGTVSHGNTGLMWQQGTASPRSWEAAISYCEGLGLASFGDWRLPNVNELQTIVDYGFNFPSIDTSYFPVTNSSYYWSSSTFANYTSYAWRVYFYVGSVDNLNKTSSGYVRCVRSGQ